MRAGSLSPSDGLQKPQTEREFVTGPCVVWAAGLGGSSRSSFLESGSDLGGSQLFPTWSDMVHWTQSFCSVLGVGTGEEKRIVLELE